MSFDNPDLAFAAAVCLGMAAHEITAVLSSAAKNKTTPSLGYYFSRPANRLQLVLDGITAAAGYLARFEVMGLASAHEYPIITGLAIGGASAWCWARLMDLVKRRASDATEAPRKP